MVERMRGERFLTGSQLISVGFSWHVQKPADCKPGLPLESEGEQRWREGIRKDGPKTGRVVLLWRPGLEGQGGIQFQTWAFFIHVIVVKNPNPFSQTN